MKFKKFFSKWGWITIWALASIVIAVIIHLLFSFPAHNEFFVAKWGAGDILSYISTVALGLLAMWQNQKLTIESKNKEEENRTIEKSIIFDFENVKCYFYNSGDTIDFNKPADMWEGGFNGAFAVKSYMRNRMKERINFSIQIKNISSYIATNIRVEKPVNMKDCDTNILHDVNGTNTKRYILPDKSGVIKLDFPCNELNSSKEFSLCFCNQFGDKYSQKIVINNNNPVDYLVKVETQVVLDIKTEETSNGQT